MCTRYQGGRASEDDVLQILVIPLQSADPGRHLRSAPPSCGIFLRAAAAPFCHLHMALPADAGPGQAAGGPLRAASCGGAGQRDSLYPPSPQGKHGKKACI